MRISLSPVHSDSIRLIKDAFVRLGINVVAIGFVLGSTSAATSACPREESVQEGLS